MSLYAPEYPDVDLLERRRSSRPHDWEQPHAVTAEYRARAPRAVPAVAELSERSRMRAGTAHLRGMVRSALADPRYDFRTQETIAAATDLSPRLIRILLQMMADEVRRPVDARPNEMELYRLRSRGLTWQERWRRTVTMLSRD